MGKLRQAIEDGLQVGALTCDAIAQFLFPREEWRHTLFILDEHPHLRHVKVAMPDVSVYQTLLAAGRSDYARSLRRDGERHDDVAVAAQEGGAQ